MTEQVVTTIYNGRTLVSHHYESRESFVAGYLALPFAPAAPLEVRAISLARCAGLTCGWLHIFHQDERTHYTDPDPATLNEECALPLIEARAVGKRQWRQYRAHQSEFIALAALAPHLTLPLNLPAAEDEGAGILARLQ